MHNGFIVEVKDLKPHSNADRLQIATFFGETVIVGLEVKIGDIGIYFPCDLQLSEAYCDANDICRKRADGTNGNGYLERDKRNVRAINLRGEKSYGLYAPLDSLEYTGVDMATLTVGTPITVVNGHEICCKYIPRTNVRSDHSHSGNKTRKHKDPISPLFQEHADTEQLAYNLAAFKPGDEIEITLKMHGTSQRTAHLPVLAGYKRTLWDKIFKREGTPIYAWGGISGTRRVVLDSYDGGFYGSNEFREQHSKAFEGKLWKGETVYYEVVGFTHTGAPIMASADNKKIADKDFMKQYGKETVFSYGCSPNPVCESKIDFATGVLYDTKQLEPQSDIYVYRMTMTNEDGNVVEYTPDFMRYRCEQMGVKSVPVFGKAIIGDDRLHFIDANGIDHVYMMGDGTIGDMVKRVAEEFYDGPDPVGKTHVREGVVVRIVNRPKFCAYKHKNHSFKVLEGIIKEDALAPDMEEASGLEEEI